MTDETHTKDVSALSSRQQTLNMWALSGEVGLIIVIPLVILMLAGIKLDRTFGTLPLFIIIALVLSPILSGVALWRKIKKLTV